MFLFIVFVIIFTECDIASSECTDIYGRSIPPNSHFIPGPDICLLCVCDNTQPKWCKRVLCSPPQNCKSFVMGNSCCDYSCLDNTLPNGDYKEEVDRKFLITVGTAFLILTILLFIVHRFRFRTIHGHLQNTNEGGPNVGFLPTEYLNLSSGHHFDDHPLVHFPIVKPNAFYLREDPPPPYDEVMGDTSNIAYASQLLTNNRGIYEVNHQRRRSNLTALHNLGRSNRILLESHGLASEQQNTETSFPIATTNIYSCSLQHRSIPLSVCSNVDNRNRQLKCSTHSTNSYHIENRKSCPVHKNASGICRSRTEEYHNNDPNSNNHNRVFKSETRSNIYPPQLHFESLYTGVRPFQHRTLPLSVSLSSPLPSTSDSCDRQIQFATFSSAVNISSSDGDEPSCVTLEPLVKKSFKNFTVTIPVDNESNINNTRENKSTIKETALKDHNMKMAYAENMCKNSECELSETNTSQLIDDYHAECENCNLNVNSTCEVSDEYFSEQETMTLQRKLHEVSAIKCNDQAMKISLTLPTNSRIRRCSSKSQKSGRWNTKESPFKTKLEYVSSEDEDVDIDEFQTVKKIFSDNNKI